MYLFSVEIDTMDVYVDGEKLDTFVSVLHASSIISLVSELQSCCSIFFV